MASKEKDRLNLNNYKWWRNHRRIITLSLLAFLLANFVREPQRKLFNSKHICGQWWMGQLDKDIAYKKLSLKPEGDLIEYCVHFR